MRGEVLLDHKVTQSEIKIESFTSEKIGIRNTVNIINYLEPDDVHAILDAASVCKDRDHLLIRVLWQTGIRLDELLHMRPCDLEYDNKMLRIVKAKGNKQRRIPIDTWTLSLLQNYIGDYDIDNDRPIFPISQQRARVIVKRYGKTIGKDVHPHTFRHSYAINMVRQGCDIRRLQLFLGHSSIATTAIYLQFNDDDLRDIYDRVSF